MDHFSQNIALNVTKDLFFFENAEFLVVKMTYFREIDYFVWNLANTFHLKIIISVENDRISRE